jgi:hypothetical protein
LLLISDTCSAKIPVKSNFLAKVVCSAKPGLLRKYGIVTFPPQTQNSRFSVIQNESEEEKEFSNGIQKLIAIHGNLTLSNCFRRKQNLSPSRRDINMDQYIPTKLYYRRRGKKQPEAIRILLL